MAKKCPEYHLLINQLHFTILKLTGTINILFFEDNKPLQYRTLQSHTHKVTVTGSLIELLLLWVVIWPSNWTESTGRISPVTGSTVNIYHVEHFVSQSPFNPVITYGPL